MEEIKQQRIHILDELRGFAIICMVFHHAFYDVGSLLGYQWGYDLFNWFKVIQPVFWFLFIVISGICTSLSRSSLKRGLLVEGLALGVTLVTAVFMPLFGFYNEEIYFGILHCLGICMILFALGKHLFEKINPFIGGAVSMTLFAITYNVPQGFLFFSNFLRVDLPVSWYTTSFLFPLGFFDSSFHSADYFPLIPWLFLFFFGAFVGIWAKRDDFSVFPKGSHSVFLQRAGRYSLWIYIAHQPVLYGFFLLLTLFL